MKSIVKFLVATTALFVGTAASVLAAPQLTVPEPGSLALVGLAIAALVVVARKGRK